MLRAWVGSAGVRGCRKAAFSRVARAASHESAMPHHPKGVCHSTDGSVSIHSAALSRGWTVPWPQDDLRRFLCGLTRYTVARQSRLCHFQREGDRCLRYPSRPIAPASLPLAEQELLLNCAKIADQSESRVHDARATTTGPSRITSLAGVTVGVSDRGKLQLTPLQ